MLRNVIVGSVWECLNGAAARRCSDDWRHVRVVEGALEERKLQLMTSESCGEEHVALEGFTWEATRSKPHTASVTVCSTCRRGLASMNQKSFSRTRNSTVQSEERGGSAAIRRIAAAGWKGNEEKHDETRCRRCREDVALGSRTSHVTRHTSHVRSHTSHVTRLASQLIAHEGRQ
jgi:hypothetical protein